MTGVALAVERNFEGKVEKNPMTVLKRFSRRTIEVADFYVKGKISDTKIATMGVRKDRGSM